MTPLDKHVGVIGNGLIFMTEFTATQALDDALIKIDNLCEDTGLLCWLTDDEQSALKQLWKAIRPGDTITVTHITQISPEESSDVENDECPGHPVGPFDSMGKTAYCDGSCVIGGRR